MARNIVFQYLGWHFYDTPKGILRGWKNCLKFNLNYWSVPVLAKTFFSHWRRYRYSYGKSFDLRVYFEAFTFNIISRSLGAIMRSIFIVLGLATEIFVIFSGLVVFLFWMVLPIFLIAALIYGIRMVAPLTAVLSFLFLFLIFRSFLNSKWKNSVSDSLSYGAHKTIKRGRIDDAALKFIFYRLLLNPKEIKKIKIDFDEKIISEAKKIAEANSRQKIETGDLLVALFKIHPVFQKILVDNNLRIEDVENLVWWLGSLEKKNRESKRWWDYENLIKRGTLAKEWTAGYTLTLDKYSTDWTEIGKKRGFPEIIGHKEQIEQAERVLARHEYNNVLLVGEPGVGREGIIHGLVNKAIFGQSLPDVNYKRVVELDMSALLAEITNPDEVSSVLDKIFQEAIAAGNVILVINEFHNFIGVKPGPGMIDISGAISPYLHLPKFQIVAITTYAGLHKNIEPNPSILNLFEKVEVPEIPERETLMILENLTLILEHKYKLFVAYPALREIVSLSARFMPSLPFPKKARDLLDEAVIYVKKSTKDKVVLPKHVAEVITIKTQIPVGEMESKEKQILLNLEELIHQRIINQEEAVKEVSTALRRARSEVTVRKGPMGTFLFLGPTGVGKTETAKALTEIYFGSEKKMIRLDMSEFQDIKDISRLIGSAGEEGLLTTQAAENPFSMILLDEIEKAHPNILNLFLQVLDEGFLTDGLGRKIDFKSSIIIATSNAGYQIILEAIKQKTEWSGVKQKLLDYVFEKAIFRPEFINRFDAMVVFKPLSKEHLLAIAELLFRKLKNNLKEKGIEFVATMPLKEKIVELGYNPTFGAREMRRVIQDKVENGLASALLSGQLKRGQSVEVDSDTFQLAIK